MSIKYVLLENWYSDDYYDNIADSEIIGIYDNIESAEKRMYEIMIETIERQVNRGDKHNKNRYNINKEFFDEQFDSFGIMTKLIKIDVINDEDNLIELHKSILEGRYKIGPLQEFEIKEVKHFKTEL